MIKRDERIEQFKRDCKSYNYYIKRIIECNERIEELDVRLQGVSSPNGNTNTKTSGTGTHPSIVALIMEQDEWRAERALAERHVNVVSEKLNKIKNATDREMVRDMYILNKYYPALAEKYGYNDKSYLMRKANKILGKIV